jgi:hypothetical protein
LSVPEIVNGPSRILERLAETVAGVLPGRAVPGLNRCRKDPLSHDQPGDRQPLKQQMVDAETGDVVEVDQKARGYELTKGKYGAAGKMSGTMRRCVKRPGLGFLECHCGNYADWNCSLTIWEWVKLIATALSISIAMTAVGAAAVWLIAK